MRTLIITLITLILIIPAVIYAVSITNHTIQPQNATTQDIIVCSWTPSADTTQQNATWWNGSTIYSTSTIPFSQNQTTLGAGIAKKNQVWTCEVTLTNGTSTQSYNQSVTIANAYPSPPNATNQTLYEDHNKIIPLSATDPDGDTITYYQLNTSFYCTIGTTTGIVDCNPNQTHIGTTNVTFYSKDDSDTLVGKEVTYTVIEVNDEPQFSVTDQNATEGVLFNYTITATDEENNTPFTFTVESNLTTIIIKNISATSAYITFNRASNAPVYSEKGPWWVRVNVTDTGTNNTTPYDSPTHTETFTLTVITVNHAPNITTNLTGINGTQGENFTLIINATDIDEQDNLTFSITSNCSITNPWSITTTNSSNNATGLINLTLTNNHVICRWVNISVTDAKEYDWEITFFNITNTNDEPVIHEESHYSENSGTNMSNLTAVKDKAFTYLVNATDPDEKTYEGETLTYADNTTLFEINSTTGLIQFTPQESDIGNHTILINVTDDEGLWTTRLLLLRVLNNTPPQLQPIGNVSCAEDTLCTKFIQAHDPDPGETLTFNSNNTDVFNITSYNATAAILNYTPTNDQVGNYTINVTVTDQYGFIDYEVFRFTINNTNDEPFFDQDNDGTPDTVSFGTVVEEHTTTQRINVTDDDLDIGQDNLTYDWEFTIDPYNLSSNFTIKEEGEDYFIITFTPNNTQAGNYTVNLSTTDRAGATYYQLVTFEVLDKTSDPVITRIRPYRNSTNETTTLSFGSTSWFPNRNTTANTTENNSITIDAIAINDTTINNNQLTYYWYVNNELNETKGNAKPGTNSSLTLNFNFFSAGNYTILLIVEDKRYSQSNWTWRLTVDDVNRPPQYVGELDNLTVNGTIEIQDYFSYRNGRQRFYDPDDDTNSDGVRGSIFGENTSLTYGFPNGYDNCSIASFSFSGDNLIITPTDEGTCFVTFRATDPYGEYADSGLVRIMINDVDTTEVPVTTSSSGGGSSRTKPRIIPIPIEEPEEVPQPLKIIIPEAVTTYANRTAKIPVTLKNTWNDTLTGIRVNASVNNDSINVTLRLSNTEFPEIKKGENESLTLYIEGYREDSPYEVTITATVDDPEYTDSATVMINSMEQRSEGEDVESKVVFARDLLNDNPECQELNELLDKAEEERQRGNIQEAVKLINTVVNGCKYLINQEKIAEEEQPKMFYTFLTTARRNLKEIIIGGVIIGILITLMIILTVTAKKHKPKKQH